MKKLTVILIMVSMCTAALFAQETENTTDCCSGETATEKNGFFATIIDGFVESTRTIHQINQEHMAEIRSASVNPDIERLNETEGFGNKIRVIFSNMRNTAVTQAEIQRERREAVQNQYSYRNILENQRTAVQARYY